MIEQHTSPQGKVVYCTDNRGQEDSLTVGCSYVIQYWDGCCINVYGDDGIGVTVNRDRFARSIDWPT